MGWGRARLIPRIDGVVAELFVLDEQPHHIDAEPIYPAIQPEPKHIQHRFTQLRVAPVYIWLLLQERAVVILSRPHIPLPSRAAEVAQPVIRWAAIISGISPQIPIALRVFARGTALEEPWMFIRGVIRNKVK